MKMTAKELKDALSSVSDDAHVVFEMSSGCCGDYKDMELSFIDDSPAGKDYPAFFRFRLDAVNGYHSCRQAAKTERDHKEYWDAVKKSHQRTNEDR